MNKNRQLFKLYLWGMAEKKKDEKKPIKTMAELTKGFDEFQKNNELKENATKRDFDKAIAKALESQPGRER